MAIRGFEYTLRCRQCIQQAARPSHRRTFTSSPSQQKHGALPTFTPTSSPDLDALLSTFRSKIFVPSHLLKRHRDLVYRKRHHRLLTSEPLTVTIGAEEIPLEPLDHLVDEPNTRKGFAGVLQLMREPRDWDNMPGFLAGLQTAKRRVEGGLLEKMVRRANELGRQGTVMECVRRSATTGLVLDEAPVVREVMWGARLRARQAEWSEEGLGKALKQAEQVLELLEDPKHSSRKGVEGVHFSRMPDVVGIVLELVAARAVRYGEGKDEDGKVAVYATATVAGLRTQAPNTDLDASNWYDANYELQRWAPVLHGLRLAVGVLKDKPQLAKDVRNSTRKMEEAVSKARDIVVANTSQDRTRRGLMVYDDISS